MIASHQDSENGRAHKKEDNADADADAGSKYVDLNLKHPHPHSPPPHSPPHGMHIYIHIYSHYSLDISYRILRCGPSLAPLWTLAMVSRM